MFRSQCKQRCIVDFVALMVELTARKDKPGTRSNILEMQHTPLRPELELEIIDKHDGWSTIYQHICTEAQQRFELSFSDSRRAEFRTRNRYKDISPYDHSRIKLKRNNIDYINASRIEVPQINRTYILTQGPLLQTVSHFWVMVWEKKCPAVVMLNRLVEKDQPKCHPYFPTGVNGDLELVMEDVQLGVSFVEEQKRSPHFVTRLLRLKDLESGNKLDLLHYHYLLWPDFGVPFSPDSFLNLLFSVREAGILRDPGRPVVVHCSAGVGRSGVFCVVDACLKMAEDKGDSSAVNLRGTLVEMRRSRMGLIQTPQQLRFAYVALVEALKTKKLIKSFEPASPGTEGKFVLQNFVATPTTFDVMEDDEDASHNNSHHEGFESLVRSQEGSRSSRGKKRCSLRRFTPHPGSIEDPESVWLMNNSTISGEPLIRPGLPHSEGADMLCGHWFSSVDGVENGNEEEEEEEGDKNSNGGDDDGEDGYYGDREGSGVDENFENEDGAAAADDDDDEEIYGQCVDGHGCMFQAPRLSRRPLEEREKKSWEELHAMLRSQDGVKELVEVRRKKMRSKVVGWSVLGLLLGLVVYRCAW